MNNKLILSAGLLAGLLLIVLIRYFSGGDESDQQADDNLIESALESTPEPAQTAAPAAVMPAPQPPAEESLVSAELVEEPESEVVALPEETVVEPDAVELPVLNESDGFVAEQVGTLNNGNDILQLMTSNQTVRKFVVLIDNMSRGDIPVGDLPVLGPRKELTAREIEENRYVMQAVSFERFDEFVQTLTNLDTEQAIAMFSLFEPLFDNAYAELGYRDRRFRDTVKQAMDNVLAAPIVTDDRIELVRPSVFYEFADPALENLTNVEKLLIRMGPDNASRVKEKIASLQARL